MKYSEMFQVKSGDKIKLDKIDPAFTDGFKDTDGVDDKINKYTERLRALQYDLYAEGKRSLLICLQGLDAAGKDGTIAHVLGAMDPQGTRVCGFKIPSVEEASHDFLWRIEKQVPAKERWSFSTALIMKTSWWFGCIKQSRRKFGQIGIV